MWILNKMLDLTKFTQIVPSRGFIPTELPNSLDSQKANYVLKVTLRTWIAWVGIEFVSKPLEKTPPISKYPTIQSHFSGDHHRGLKPHHPPVWYVNSSLMSNRQLSPAKLKCGGTQRAQAQSRWEEEPGVTNICKNLSVCQNVWPGHNGHSGFLINIFF